MKHIITFLLLLIILKTADVSGQDYAIGADLSFLKSAEDKGFTFKENDAAKSGLLIFKDHGYNWIRLRLFHTPAELPNNLEYTIALAKRAKENGFRFLARLSLFRYMGRSRKTVYTEGMDRIILIASL